MEGVSKEGNAYQNNVIYVSYSICTTFVVSCYVREGLFFVDFHVCFYDIMTIVVCIKDGQRFVERRKEVKRKCLP